MCKSHAEGGQRCAASTRAKYEATPPTSPEWEQVAVEYASTREGHDRLKDQAHDARYNRDYDLEARLLRARFLGASLREANREVAATIARTKASAPAPATPAPPAVQPVVVHVPATMSRADLLAQPEVRHLSADIIAISPDERLVAYINTSREQAAARLVRQSAEQAERRAWRKPDWLVIDEANGEPGKRAYQTADGYTAVPGTNGTRARTRSGRSDMRATGWLVRMASGAETEFHTTLRGVTDAIEFDRQHGNQRPH